MGSDNADKRGSRRPLIFSSAGHVLGLADGQLFGNPPAPNSPKLGSENGADAPDVPDDSGSRPPDEED